MESFDEIEEAYKRDIERLDKEFLDSFSKKTKNTKNIETDYKTRLRRLIFSYEHTINSYLKRQKRAVNRKEEKEKTPEEEESGVKKKSKRGKKTPLSLTRKEKFLVKFALFKFRCGIKLKKFFHKIMPSFLIILWIRIKIFLSRRKEDFLSFFHKLASKTKQGFSNCLDKSKETSLKVLSKAANFSKSAYAKIKSRFVKKKQGEQKEKSEDEKIADKILAQKPDKS